MTRVPLAVAMSAVTGWRLVTLQIKPLEMVLSIQVPVVPAVVPVAQEL